MRYNRFWALCVCLLCCPRNRTVAVVSTNDIISIFELNSISTCAFLGLFQRVVAPHSTIGLFKIVKMSRILQRQHLKKRISFFTKLVLFGPFLSPCRDAEHRPHAETIPSIWLVSISCTNRFFPFLEWANDLLNNWSRAFFLFFEFCRISWKFKIKAGRSAVSFLIPLETNPSKERHSSRVGGELCLSVILCFICFVDRSRHYVAETQLHAHEWMVKAVITHHVAANT